MDFTYSEEQQMLADSLRRFVDTRYPFDVRRKSAREGASFDPDVWKMLTEMGIIGLTLPEAFGGFGEGAATRLVVQRELGRALVHEPVIATGVIAAEILNAFGNPAQKDAWLPAIGSGRRIVTAAWLEPGSRYRPESVGTVAKPTQTGYAVSGVKSLVWHGEVADAFLLTAKMEGTNDIGLFIVPSNAPGLTVTGYPTIDGQRAADLHLEGVELIHDAIVGNPGQGLSALEHGLAHGIAAMCAEAAGAMEKLIEITAEYLRTRRQFGQPLGAFQALQHRMADMLVQKELALSMAYVAAQAIDEVEPAQRRRMLCAAKIVVAKAGRFVGQQAVQLHGGMGVTDELEVGDYLKRLTMFDPLLGDSDYHLARYCEAMQA